ncbi:hypothetical protein SEVIR_2G051966v4 [Setaria viridis]|uniref:Uncharacterized protein n=1 Tax=Setaria viridis TaxID=4556 RepID=A0A4U6VP36_SETVI|nr:hypothetical protein SEVIR_2G051966v2 [Setaria viridis]TKW30655.1 hypothetical protein SEVIR_2G051966v2 [Setaria viridis]
MHGVLHMRFLSSVLSLTFAKLSKIWLEVGDGLIHPAMETIATLGEIEPNPADFSLREREAAPDFEVPNGSTFGLFLGHEADALTRGGA